MTNDNNGVTLSPDEIAALCAEIPWQLALVSRDGTILSVSQALLGLLQAPAEALLNTRFGSIVGAKERAQFEAVVGKLVCNQPGLSLRVHLERPAGAPIAVELQLALVRYQAIEYLVVVVCSVPIINRRQRIMLEFNLLAPSLFELQSADQLYDKVALALQPLSIALVVMALRPEQGQLQLEYSRLGPALTNLLGRYGISPPLDLQALHGMPSFGRLLERHESLFVESGQLRADVLPKHTRAEAQAMLALLGRPNCILSPLLDGQQIHGVLVFWSPMLDRQQAPAIEAFTNQLATVRAQIALRAQMQRQVQRLESLAATAQAVTSLQRLDDVLRVVCMQAQKLLEAQFARIAAPIDQNRTFKYIMSTGEQVEELLQLTIPLEASISGAVFRSGKGRVIDDLQQDPQVHAPFKAHSTARSVLYQPLEHQGAVLGVLIVGHSAVGYFHQAALDYAGRYAEYAAVAIANAQLHAALQQSEAEQQRQRRELQALLQVSQALNFSLDLDTLLEDALLVIEQLGLANMSAVILLSSDQGRLELRGQRGMREPLTGGVQALLGEPALFEAVRSGQQLRLTKAHIAQLMKMASSRGETAPLHTIIIPLTATSQPLGALMLSQVGEHDYSERDIKLLGAIANQVAQAIAKAVVHETLRVTASDNERLYREAEEVRSYLNTLVRNTPDVLMTIRSDMTIHVLNPERLASLSLLDAQQIEGLPFLSLAPAHLREHLSQLWQAVRSGRPQTYEMELQRPNGAPLFLLLSAALIADYGEIFVMLKDVTEQRQREAYLRQNDKLAALGSMVAGAAHELNNPLAAILGLAELQLDQAMPDQLRSDLEQIERSALRARSIVQQLLNFARPQPLRSQPVAIGTLIHETLGRLAQTFRASAIDTTITIAPDLPDTAGDPHQLEQVLFNIFHNAALSMAANRPGLPRELHISATEEQDLIQIVIQDSGPGIAQDQLPRIFDPFFTTRSVGQGTGLGLAISHTIIHQHDGRIWATSQPNKGATFFVQLPIGQPAQLPASVPGPPSASAQILLIEDEDLVRQVIARTLLRQGYDVEAVASGAEAIERALARDYDLLISDLHMPGIDGPTLHSRLRLLRPHFRWMIITGDTMNERSHEFLQQTGLPALPKPFTSEQLLARVAECLAANSKITGSSRQ